MLKKFETMKNGVAMRYSTQVFVNIFGYFFEKARKNVNLTTILL